MFSYIEKIRKEPLERRRQVAIVATAVIVGAVILLWIVYLFLTQGFILNGGDSDTTNTENERRVTGGIESPY